MSTLEDELAARKGVILKRRALRGEKFAGSKDIRREYRSVRKEANAKIKQTKYEKNPITKFKKEHGGLTPEQYSKLEEKGLSLQEVPKNSDGTVDKRFLSGPKPGDFKNRLKNLRQKFRRDGLPEKAEHTSNHQPRTITNPLGAGGPVPQIDVEKMSKQSHDILETTQKVASSGINFESLPGFYETKYTPETKLHAVTCYIVTGSLKEASKFSAVPADTIKSWRKTAQWWPAVSNYVQQARQEELDAKLSGVIHKSMEIVSDRLEEGDYKYNAKLDKLVRVPVSAKDATAVADKAIHNRNLLRGDPTSRTETTTLAEKINELKLQFKSFTEQKVIEGEYEQSDD